MGYKVKKGISVFFIFIFHTKMEQTFSLLCEVQAQSQQCEQDTMATVKSLQQHSAQLKETTCKVHDYVLQIDAGKKEIHDLDTLLEEKKWKLEKRRGYFNHLVSEISTMQKVWDQLLHRVSRAQSGSKANRCTRWDQGGLGSLICIGKPRILPTDAKSASYVDEICRMSNIHLHTKCFNQFAGLQQPKWAPQDSTAITKSKCRVIGTAAEVPKTKFRRLNERKIEQGAELKKDSEPNTSFTQHEEKGNQNIPVSTSPQFFSARKILQKLEGKS